MAVPFSSWARSRRGGTGVITAVLLAAGLLAGCTTPAPGAPGGTDGAAIQTAPRLASFTVQAAAGDELLHLSWQYASGSGAPGSVHLDLYKYGATGAVRLGSTIVGQTVEPRTYDIPAPPGTWAVRATPENDGGFGPGITSPPVTVKNPCPTATLCARVTAGTLPAPATTVRLAAEGFTHSLLSNAVANAATTSVAPLAPRQWRFAGPASDAAARQLGASRTQVLSDLWNDVTARANGGYARTPWSDWNAWDTFVGATVRAARAQGWSPEFWDVWNEPNGTCCPRFSPADIGSVSVANWIEAYDRAWRAIKAADPSAKVIGPSLSALQWAPGSPAEFDLDTFLADAHAHGIVWDAVSWHENTTAPSPGDLASSVTNVDRHIAMAKAVMARHPGTVAGNTIVVNEYDPASVHVLPGWAVGYFRAFEDGGVHEANVACWSAAECNAQLDGLLTASGGPTAVWWAHKLYSDLAAAGAARVRVVSSSSWELDGLATRTDSTRTVRALLGRHWSCSQPVNPWCGRNAHIANASLTLTVDWPYGSAPVTVRVDELPAGSAALTAPVRLQSIVVHPSAGTIRVTVPTVHDGDALSITAH